jgi:hypothetical protein
MSKSKSAADQVADHKAADDKPNPDELRRDIEHTRRDLGDTVEELAEKADVKAQVKERVEESKATVTAQANQRGPQLAAGAIAFLILLLLLRRRRR